VPGPRNNPQQRAARSAPGSPVTTRAEPVVRRYHQILLWPVQLMPLPGKRAGAHAHWELLADAGGDCPWAELADEFTGDASQFQERHYREFVTFLPQVQRFLYGEGKGRGTPASESPIRVFRRHDVKQLRLVFPDARHEPVLFEVAHVDLLFYYDIDVAILVVEISARDLPLVQVQRTLHRFGRTYPTSWSEDGSGEHCVASAEWLSAHGEVLAASDFAQREKFLSSVCRHRAAAIAAHWDFLMRPLVLHHSDEAGAIRFRQLEDHRMALAAYLALDDARALTRGDFMRLAFTSAPGAAASLPFSERRMRDFEQTYCIDRHWDEVAAGAPGVRYLCTGDAFVMVGEASDRYFVDAERGLLGHFRHQYFLLFLAPHFYKATLLMFSDRLVDAVNRLDVLDAESVRRFKLTIRRQKEMFLRFAHRYWSLELTRVPLASEIFRQCSELLGTERLYADVREEIEDMSAYLDSDSLRRQANTVTRLTVVTAFGMIGTIATGFLGMNLIDEAANPFMTKLLYFALVFVPVALLTFYTILKAKRLSDFLEALADERLPARAKLGALLDVWRNRRAAGRRGGPTP